MQVIQAGLIFSLVCAVGAVLYGIVSRNWILSLPSGNDRMREIAAAIQQGAEAYLRLVIRAAIKLRMAIRSYIDKLFTFWSSVVTTTLIYSVQ